MTNESARIIFASDARRPRPHHRRGSASGPPAQRRHGHPRAAYGRAGADGRQDAGQSKRPPQRRPGMDGDGPETRWPLSAGRARPWRRCAKSCNGGGAACRGSFVTWGCPPPARKVATRAGTLWTEEDEEQLRKLYHLRCPVEEMARELERSVRAVHLRIGAAELYGDEPGYPAGPGSRRRHGLRKRCGGNGAWASRTESAITNKSPASRMCLGGFVCGRATDDYYVFVSNGWWKFIRHGI